jgi:hypothetical protein
LAGDTIGDSAGGGGKEELIGQERDSSETPNTVSLGPSPFREDGGGKSSKPTWGHPRFKSIGTANLANHEETQKMKAPNRSILPLEDSLNSPD